MPRISDSDVAPRRLECGYYLAKVCGKVCRDTAAVVVDSAGAIPNARTLAPLRFGRLFLLRIRALALVSCSQGDAPLSSAPRLRLLRLPRFLVPLVKLLVHSRVKSRVPLLSNGYFSPLSGWRLPPAVAEYRKEQQIQAQLAPYGLHDANIPFVQAFDSGVGWLTPPTQPWRPRLPHASRRIAVVLHLYYADLWRELSAFLAKIQRPFDLIVTHGAMGDHHISQIQSLFPQSRLVRVENRGRDVWPFLSLLNDGVLGHYDYVCKIHAKKSIHDNGYHETLLGLRWRRRALWDLLGGDRSEMIVQMFERDPYLGMVGPQNLRLPSAAVPARTAWGCQANRRNVAALLNRMGESDRFPLDYFAGSMFWVAPRALEPLRRLNLTREDFPDETGQLDGELQHAIERLFPLAALLSGRQMGAVPPLELVTQLPSPQVMAAGRIQRAAG